MKTYYYGLSFILLHQAIPAVAQPGVQDFARLKQLAGTWQAENSEEYECWHLTGGNTLSGMGYRLDGKDTVINERLELRLSGDSIAYIATVIRQNEGKPVIFGYKGQNEQGFIFENMEHDFPQTIVYRFDNNDRIGIVLTGDGNKGKKTVRFNMHRKKE